jgi:hypothetical protein
MAKTEKKLKKTTGIKTEFLRLIGDSPEVTTRRDWPEKLTG